MPFALPQPFRRRHAAWWTLAAGLALTAALGWELHREAVEMDRQRLEMRVAEIQGQLDARLEKSEMLLHNLRDFLSLSRESSELVFQRWCYDNGLSINCPWILGIAVATNRNRISWREHLPIDLSTWTTNEWVAARALAESRPLHLEIILKSEVREQMQFLRDYELSPAFSNAGYGYRNWHGTNDWLAVSIRQSSRIGMSGRRTVMAAGNGDLITGTLFHVPIHSMGLADFMPLTESASLKFYRNVARWMELESVIIAPVDFRVLTSSIWGGTAADLGIEIFSSTNQTAGTWMNPSGSAPRADDPNFKAYLFQRLIWPMYGMKFSIFFYTTPLFEAQSPRRMAKVAMAAGVVLTLLASALAGVTQRAQNRQERMIEQLREARDALRAAQQERNSISRDLHDGTVQSLYAIQLGLDHAAREFKTAASLETGALTSLRKELDAVIAEIRQFITTETGGSSSVDFAAVLESLVQRAKSSATASIVLDCDASAARPLAAEEAVQLANIAREAMSNSLRHGQPRELRVTLSRDSDTVVLNVADDGRGFNPSIPSRAGLGLASMASRAREIGASLRLHSAPDKGTIVEVRLPICSEDRNSASA